MKSYSIANIVLILAVGLVVGCGRRASEAPATAAMIPSPASQGSSEPNLFAPPGERMILSWIEPVDSTRNALRFSTRERSGWSRPLTVAEGDDWFINWADFPSVVETREGTLTAHWLQKSGEGTYAYGVRVSRSRDGGRTWSKPISPHPIDGETEHGFVAMTPLDGDRVLLAWLDGRQFADDTMPDVMTLHGAVLESDGRLTHEVLVDDRVCDCCQNAAAMTDSGVLLVYRNRSETEIRDTGIVRFHDGRWTEPRTLYHDGWEINGCPVNGPSIAARGARVVVAWFTMIGGSARVKAAFSEDSGETFSAPIVIDDGDPLGRVDTVMLPDGSALVSWLEIAQDEAEIRLRRIHPDGTADPSQTVVRASSERAGGFPVMALGRDEVLFAWTDPGEPSNVRTASLPWRTD